LTDFTYPYLYFTTFPSSYLQTLHTINIDDLPLRNPLLKLYHTHRYNLMNTHDRTDFIREFVARLRFVASGDAGIGYLRGNCPVIHRDMGMLGVGDLVLRPPQEGLDEPEE
jgi:hypothetical protein